MLFSQRKGYKEVREFIQKESIDEDLKNGLWNALQICVWNLIKYRETMIYPRALNISNLYSLFRNYWLEYFKRPLDTMPEYFDQALKFIRNYFYKCEWYEVYDFIEFTANKLSSKNKWDEIFTSFCNKILEEEKSAYRFIDNTLVEITSQVELHEIKDTLKITEKFAGTHEHLSVALKMLSDRKNPDYRNSIKESISAVESLCLEISGDHKASFQKALAIIEKKSKTHGALKSGFTSIYGYTSDGDGIRHALLEESNLSFTDAKFMIVACSAFINYLIGKASDHKIKI